MNDRIQKFMEAQGLSSSELADTIGVQRSNVSHILNGRNNPSFPFIEKLLKSYPKLNAKWLLTGEGKMMEEKPIYSASLFDNLPEQVKMETEMKKDDKSSHKIEEKPVLKEVTKVNSSIKQEVTEEKDIEKIIVFYFDHTFKVYHPSQL